LNPYPLISVSSLFLSFLLLFFFFLLLLRPPISTLFPTRRSSDLHDHRSLYRVVLPREVVIEASAIRLNQERIRVTPTLATKVPRSEEHTSELQSRGHLVCRLLLEKKKKKAKYPKSRNLTK